MGSVTLNNGVSMPLVGFGTYRIKGTNLVFKVVDSALENGYRSIDTAEVYGNEEDIGAALKAFLSKHGLKREDVFITSKVGPASQGKEKCFNAVKNSLSLLQLEYIDLYLIHWPGIQGILPGDPLNRLYRKETWLQLESFYKDGTLKCIGVSNYTEKHLKDLFSYCSVTPQVLQNEFNPYFTHPGIVDFCSKHNIHFQSYSTLGGTSEHNLEILNDPFIKEFAVKYNRTPAQVILKWAVQQNIGVLPKSTNPEHIRENIQLDFQLEENDINFLNGLQTRPKLSWNPTNIA